MFSSDAIRNLICRQRNRPCEPHSGWTKMEPRNASLSFSTKILASSLGSNQKACFPCIGGPT